MIAVLAILLALIGCEDPAKASSLFSDDGSIVKLELWIDAPAIEQLESKPRDWAEAKLVHGDSVLERVAIRVKGHRSKQRIDEKPALKLDFSKYDPARRFFGLERLTLNNMVEDPTMVHEMLAYRVHRALGVLVPELGYAELYLNGKYIGLYLMVEPIDDHFFSSRGRAQDRAYEGEYGCDVHPEDVDGFDQDAGEKTRRDLASFAEAAGGPAFDLFHLPRAPVEQRRLLGFLAASALIGDFDGYRQSHNYYLHQDVARSKWSLIPWGADRTFQTPLGIFDSGGVLAQKCFADLACREEYVKTVRTAVDLFEGLDLIELAERLDRAIAVSARTDPKKPYTVVEMRRSHRELMRFLRSRPEQVRQELGCWNGSELVDRDGDGHACGDCNDADPSINPDAIEFCDGKDNDCSGLVDDGAECECPSFRSNGVTFYLCDLPMTWERAAEFCALQGHQLARIDSTLQSGALNRAAQKVRKGRWWIGFNDRRIEDDYQWADGSPVTFADWDRGEPDNYVCNQDCAALTEKGRWHDDHCGHRFPFVCR